jgi:hypothetical protein
LTVLLLKKGPGSSSFAFTNKKRLENFVNIAGLAPQIKNKERQRIFFDAQI